MVENSKLSESSDGKVVLYSSEFGKWKNPKTGIEELVEKFIWKTANLLEISIITFGARFASIKVPDRYGNVKDILMGFDNLEGYLNDENQYFGSTIGPVSGIIKNARFCINGSYQIVPRNFKSKHCLNGGSFGFSSINWIPFVDGTDLVLSHMSTETENFFPGSTLVQILVQVKSSNEMLIKLTARSSQMTPIDLSNRLFFNLAGHDAGSSEMMNHVITINANKVCTKHLDGLFKKTQIDVDGKDFDLRKPKKVGKVSYDHIYIAEKDQKFIVRIVHPLGRVLEIDSNQQTVYFSTCSEFPENEPIIIDDASAYDSTEHLTMDYLRTKLTEKEIAFFRCRTDRTVSFKFNNKNICEENLTKPCAPLKDENVNHEPIRGKNNSIYYKNSGFFMSFQNFPNAVNHKKHYSDIILKPGSVYENVMILKFGIHDIVKPEQQNQNDSELNFPVKIPYMSNFPTQINFLDKN